MIRLALTHCLPACRPGAGVDGWFRLGAGSWMVVRSERHYQWLL